MSGFIVALDRPRDMAVRLIELAKDPKLRRRMARASLQRAASFSAERMAAMIQFTWAAPRKSRFRVARVPGNRRIVGSIDRPPDKAVEGLGVALYDMRQGGLGRMMARLAIGRAAVGDRDASSPGLCQ